MATFESLRDRIRPDVQRKLLDAWQAMGEAPDSRGRPSRDDLLPERLPADVLPWIGLVDVLEDGAAFRYRLVGSGMNRLYGRDYTGHRVEAAKAAGYAAALNDYYGTSVRESAVIYVEAISVYDIGIEQISYRLLLPLFDGDGRTSVLLFSTWAEPYPLIYEIQLRGRPAGDAICDLRAKEPPLVVPVRSLFADQPRFNG